MKTMKKLVAALLVLTMVLALTGSAMADCKFKAGTWVKFVKNAFAYDTDKKMITGPEIIVRKGSWAKILAMKGSYALVQLTPWYPDEDYGNTLDVESGLYCNAYLFKTSTLDTIKEDAHKTLAVTFANGGVGNSKATVTEDGKIIAFKDTGAWQEDGGDRISEDCKKHVKATAKVWMHKTPSLSSSYGKALHDGDKVTYRRVYSYDSRFCRFYGIKYKGKCLWVSAQYSKLVK